MTNNEILKKQILYRSTHRGTKEMDLLLGSFVKKHIDEFTFADLKDLQSLLFIDDEIISKWYFNKENNKSITKNKISKLLKDFKV
jgi:antitoxin CptB